MIASAWGSPFDCDIGFRWVSRASLNPAFLIVACAVLALIYFVRARGWVKPPGWLRLPRWLVIVGVAIIVFPAIYLSVYRLDVYNPCMPDPLAKPVMR